MRKRVLSSGKHFQKLWRRDSRGLNGQGGCRELSAAQCLEMREHLVTRSESSLRTLRYCATILRFKKCRKRNARLNIAHQRLNQLEKATLLLAQNFCL